MNGGLEYLRSLADREPALGNCGWVAQSGRVFRPCMALRKTLPIRALLTYQQLELFAEILARCRRIRGEVDERAPQMEAAINAC